VAVVAAGCAVGSKQANSSNERASTQPSGSAISEPRLAGGSSLGVAPHVSDGGATKRGNMPETLVLSRADAGRVVSVAAGTEVHIALQSIGPGSFGDPIVSTGSVRLLDVSLANLRNPGGPKQVFRFRAVERGQAVVRIAHTADGPFSNPEFTITLDVE